MSRLGDSLAVARRAEFRKLFIGQAISVVGVDVHAWWRCRSPCSPSAARPPTSASSRPPTSCPLAVFVLVGGVWADRLPRQRVMLAADFVRTALQLAAAALLIAGVAQVWQLAVLQVGMGVCEAFFGPAYTGLVPEVVSAPRLQQANALQGLVISGAITLGALLAGMLVAAVGAGLGDRHRRAQLPGERVVPAGGCVRRRSWAGRRRRTAGSAIGPRPGRRGGGRRRGAASAGGRELLPRSRRRLARVHEPHVALGHGRRRGARSCSPSTAPSRCWARSSRATSTTARAPGGSPRPRWASGRSPAACSACAGARGGRCW